MLANNITKERTNEDATELFEKVKEVVDNDRQVQFTTDKLPSYPHAIFQTFHKINDWKETQKAVKHITDAGINQVHKNNNMVERYHNEFREFDKVRRGIDEVKAFNQGFRLYHNFIKENSTIGMTPSEKAGINLELGNNRWLGLLKKSLHSDGMQKA